MYTPRFLLCLFLAFLGALQYGLLIPQLNVGIFHTGCATDKATETCIVFPGHTTLEWTLATTSFVIGAAIGCLGSKYPNDLLGRKNTFLINAIIMILGALSEAFASSMIILTFGRFISGIASGTGVTVGGVYVSEISPAKIRGTIGCGIQLTIVSGIAIQEFLVLFFANTTLWRLLLGLPAILGIAQILLATFLVESPVWLYSHNKKDEAKNAVEKLFPMENALMILRELIGSKKFDATNEDEENNNQAKVTGKNNQMNQQISGSIFDKLFSHPSSVAMTIAVGLAIYQQFSGINAVFFYSSMFFDKAGLKNTNVANLMIGLVNAFSTLVAVGFIDKYGRRKLLLLCAGGMMFSCLLMTFAMYYKNGIAVVAFTCVYVAFFEFGLGPIFFLMIGELFPEELRATASSIATFINCVANLTISITFPFIDRAFGAFTFIPFMIILGSCYLFIYYVVIETKGKTLEDIQHELATRGHGKAQQQVGIVYTSSATPKVTNK